jgi:predicted ABC-type ATPase
LRLFPQFDERPILIALAGPNGAGKTTFYHAHVEAGGLRLVNADVLAQELGLDPYAAAKVANKLRQELLKRKESFVFETVFSDPVGDKLGFLKQAAEAGYTVVLCYIGLAGPEISEERVAMRVSQGGHDVPVEKLRSRFPRILSNLQSAIREVPHVLIYDNSDLRRPFRHAAMFRQGTLVYRSKQVPVWLKPLFG